MKRLAALVLCIAAAGAAHTEPAEYRLDPAHSFVQFEVLHFGTSTIRGRIGPVPGDVTFDRSARRLSVSLRIPMTTLSTGLAVFDSRLREPDLLAVTEHPEAYFVASNARFDGERLVELRGELTLRGVSRPFALRALRFGCRTDGAREVCGGDFEGELQRSDFGASFGLPFIADRVRLLVQAEGERR